MTEKQTEYISYYSPYFYESIPKIVENPTIDQLYYGKGELDIRYMTEVIYYHPSFGRIIYRSASLGRVRIEVKFDTPLINAYCIDPEIPNDIADLMIEVADEDLSDIPLQETLDLWKGYEVLIFFNKNHKFPRDIIFNTDLPKELIG